MATYTEIKSKDFELRKDAEDWAAEEKKDWKAYGTGGSLKIDIDYNTKNRTWTAKLLAPITFG